MNVVKRILKSIKPSLDISKLCYENVNERNCSDLFDYLTRAKSHNEPFHKSLKTCLKGDCCSDLMEFYMYKMILHDGLAVMVRNSTDNKIIAAVISNILTSQHLKCESLHLCQMPQGVVKQNLDFLNQHNRNSGIIDHLEKVFEVRLLSVDDDYNYKKIAKHLLGHCEQIAKSKGFNHIKSDVVDKEAQDFFKSQNYIMLACTVYNFKRNLRNRKLLHNPKLQLFYKRIS